MKMSVVNEEMSRLFNAHNFKDKNKYLAHKFLIREINIVYQIIVKHANSISEAIMVERLQRLSRHLIYLARISPLFPSISLLLLCLETV